MVPSCLLFFFFSWWGHVLHPWHSPCFHYLFSPRGSTVGPVRPTGSHWESLQAHLTKAMCTFKTSTTGSPKNRLIPLSGNTVWWIKEVSDLRQTQTDSSAETYYHFFYILQSLLLFPLLQAASWIRCSHSLEYVWSEGEVYKYDNI